VRATSTLLILLCACGGGKSNPDGASDGTPGDDGTPATDGTVVDAPPAPFCQPKAGTALRLQQVATALRQPVGLAAPTGDSRLFILEQPGRIRVVKDGNLLATPFLDISNQVNATDEKQGLLGLAFHPRFADNGKFYVYYTANGSNVVVAEYTATGRVAGRQSASPVTRSNWLPCLGHSTVRSSASTSPVTRSTS